MMKLSVRFTHKKWHETIFPVSFNCLFQLVTPQTQVLVTLDVPQLHQANQTRLFHA